LHYLHISTTSYDHCGTGMKPTRIEKTSQNELTIFWQDGHISQYTFQDLRDNCPCAVCRAEAIDAPGKLLPIFVEGKYILAGLKQVGTYAVQIDWRDGHNTGIYTFEYLRSLCSCGKCGIVK
jgi:DUF971 family protein